LDNTEISTLSGLSESEVIARRRAGQGNDLKIQTSRSYFQIVRDNLFTFINIVFLAISLVLISLRYYSDTLIIVGTVFGATLVNVVQEVRAKWQLDQIALLSRPKATVVREGQEQQIDPAEIVVGDILLVQPGDQILVDGQVIGDGEMEVDESLLTGESDLISKQAGFQVYSGSFCVTGSAYYEAQQVGADSLAQKLTAEARVFRLTQTPLQHEINLIIRVLLLLAIYLWLLQLISWYLSEVTLGETIQFVAVIAGLVPAGLYLSITLAYALGAVRMAKQDALIQQANAVESLSNVDVICLDKTGTLTTNRLALQAVYPAGDGIYETGLHALLGDYAATTTGGNRTNEAIAAACPGQKRPVLAKVPFSSAYKWSALTFDGRADGSGQEGVYVLGAPEILSPAVSLTEHLEAQIRVGTDQGLRVLLFAYNPDVNLPLYDGADRPSLPPNLTPLGVITFSDELRISARETLTEFAEAGVQVKIISGDNPHTVAALARQVGLGPDVRVISGLELVDMDEAQLAQTAEENTIFGRITPDQKAKLVQSLRSRGHYVAMMGDGVNDVLSLKQANVGVAMESGSQVARSVADLVLRRDSFEVLPFTFIEGQRIRNAVLDQLKLFMVRIFSAILLIVSIGLVTATFPLLIKHNGVVVLLTVGIPTIALALWAKPGQPSGRGLFHSILHFVLPSTLLLALVGLFIYLGYLLWAVFLAYQSDVLAETPLDTLLESSRSALVAIWVFCGILLFIFLKPPSRFWVGGEPLNGDRWPIYLAVAMLVMYVVIVAVPQLREFFELVPLGIGNYIFLGLIAVGWGLLLRYVWRTRLLDRFLGVDLS
jgi:cation-transporting ATPase E